MPKIIETKEAQSQIYRIRGQYVMLDSDLALLYGVETFNLNKAVKRNFKRFPDDFMFQLTTVEWDRLIFQSGISKPVRGGRRHTPYVFTQEGIAMLSGILSSERAISVNIAIMRSFVKLRHAVQAHQGVARRVEKLEGKINMHDTDIRLLVQDVQAFKRSRPEGPIRPDVY